MTYEEALKAAKGNIAHCDDAPLMAAMLDSTAQILLGAVSPKLIWQGAQAKGISTLELSSLISRDPGKARDLMWVTSDG
jgi:hypothetical protein